jgi:predicted GNAT family N-acyltransferase
MSQPPRPVAFSVIRADYRRDLDALRAVRETVFVQEQRVPIELEWDALDPDCLHVLARDGEGRPIGTGRLTPERKIGRMAVLREWRGRGVGEALLQALIDEAVRNRIAEVRLHAQVSAMAFYAKHGFLPYGERFMEAGIEHQSMRRVLNGPMAIETRESAVSIVASLIAQARRDLWVYSRNLDPGLLDAADVLDAFRRLATRRHQTQIRILLQDAAGPQRSGAPLLGLGQRLPSVFVFREVADPVDRDYPSAFIVNDDGGYYFRPLGHRFDGETERNAAARARQLVDAFQPAWERARPCTEYRALGI